MLRTRRACQDERVAAGIGDAGIREDELPSARKWRRLFWDPRGPHPMHGICGPWPTAGRRLRGPGKSMTRNQPYLLVKDLEASAQGCQALLDEWAILRSRVENDLPWQPHDRLEGRYACSGNNLSTPPSISESG